MRSNHKFIALIAATGLLASGCSATESQENSSAVETIRVATDGTISATAIHLGVEQGFFEDVGLSLEITDTPSPATTVASLQSDQIDIGTTPLIPSINAQSQNIDLISIAPSAGYPVDSKDWSEFDTSGVYVHPDSGVKSPRDMEGKKVGVNARKAAHEAYIHDLVLKDGGDPQKVDWVALDFGSQVEALRNGEIDVASLSMPFTFEAEENGADLLVNPGATFFEGGVHSTWLASPAVVDNTEIVEKFRTAVVKSNDYANQHRDEAIEKGSELTGISADTIRESGQFNYFPTELRLEDLQRMSDKLTDLGFLDEAVDMQDRVIFED